MSDQVGTTNSMLILLIVVMLVVIALAVVAILIIIRSRKKAEVPSIAPPEGPAETSLSEPLPARRVMAARFATAMGMLKQLVPGSNYRYRVPWFLLVGESGSGKTSILEHLGGAADGDILPPGAPPALSRRWRFLDQGIVIDIPGEAFLARPGTSTDQKAWLNFLRLLVHHRPKRPLEGIVLTIPATELIEASNDPDKPDRLVRVETIRERLSEAQLQLGLNLPIYILITKCDQISGFGSFCGELPPEMQQDIFGWSNPHRLDTSFSSDWVDEAFNGIHDTLLHRQMEILAGRPHLLDPDGVFLFPFELQKLREPLRVLLARAFRASAYKDAPFLRGIYFSGIVSAPAVSPATTLTPAASPEAWNAALVHSSHSPGPFLLPEVESPRLVFVQHLFDFKVFLEYRIARPLYSGFFSRNRSVIAAQVVTLLLVVVLGMGTVLAYHRLWMLQNNRIVPVLQRVSQTAEAIKVSGPTKIDPAFGLIESLDAVRQNEFRSLAMPFSYISLVRSDLRATLEQAFAKVVLQSCRSALTQRAAQLMSRDTAQPSSSVAGTQEQTLSGQAPLGAPFTLNPQYLKLQAYIGEVTALNENINRYDLLSRPGYGSFKLLGELLEYLGDRKLPGLNRLARDQYFESLLNSATWSPLEVSFVGDFRDSTTKQTSRLIEDFYVSWFDNSPLLASVESLQNELGGLTSDRDQTNQQLRSLLGNIQFIDTQLGNGSYDWIEDNFSRNTYPALGSSLDAGFFSARLRDLVTQQGVEAQSKLRTKIRGNGTVLDFNNGRVRLAGSVRMLGIVLASFTTLDFMNDSVEPSSASSIGPGPNFVWNQAALDDAQGLYNSYSKTLDEMLPALPDEYRKPLESIAAQHISATLYSATLKARIPNPDTDRQTSLDTELRSFKNSIGSQQSIQNALADLEATREETGLRKLISSQANSLLVKLDDELASVYAPQTSAVAWSGTKPLSLYLYEADSPEDLGAYLKSERQRIATLGADIAPVVQYLAAHGVRGDVSTNKWETISQDLKLFKANKPGNPISLLETFIQTDLDKITPENRCKANVSRRQADVFLNARDHLATMAANECRQLAVARYNLIASFFNEKLAGRFPFSQNVEMKDVSEADPGVVAEFYKLFDQDSPGVSDVLPQAALTPGDAIAFLQLMAKARPLIGGAEADPSPMLDLGVLFRANREREVNGNQIIDWQVQIGQQPPIQYKPVEQKLRWRLGDPVRIVLRYAKDSPYVPVATSDSGYTVQDQRTVTFNYSNLWSLFALLQSHLPPRGSAPDLAAFSFPNASVPNQGTVTGASSSDTLVFIRIDLSSVAAKPEAPGEKLSFFALPAVAPKLSAQAVAFGE